MWKGTLALWLAPCLALAAASSFQARKPPVAKPVVPFQGSYDEARTRAAERNVPLLVFAFHEDPHAPHEDVQAYRKEIFSRADLGALAPLLVIVVGGTGAHEASPLEVEVGGQKSTLALCSHYRSETCMAHQKLFDSIYKEHNVEGELKSPATLLLGPDRAVIENWSTGSAASWDEVLAAIKLAQSKAGEGLTEAAFAEVRALLARASSELDKGQFGAAWATYAKVLGITTKTKFAQTAREGEARARASIEDVRKAARESFAAGAHVDAYRELDALRVALLGTPLEKELVRELRAMETHKDAKVAIAAWKREQEAEQLWSAAQALAATQPKQAEAKVRTLLRKFADTQAGARARARYPQWAADEDQPREAK
ncbi:MAG: hypothetical protein FJ298_09595 [Planctomycetes bacterium]|nr:hypothetical protein [Planctomycetota bacterium]